VSEWFSHEDVANEFGLWNKKRRLAMMSAHDSYMSNTTFASPPNPKCVKWRFTVSRETSKKGGLVPINFLVHNRGRLRQP
jgi:hypothetical protein